VTHPNAELVERTFAAFGRDALALARGFAEDVVWRVPGDTVMSGEYRGRDDVLRFLRRTRTETDGTYRVELQYVAASDEHAVAVYRARGRRDGVVLDIDQALFCRIRDGLVAEVTAVPFDFPAFAAFWG
jgi:ketosteroid isomerase-like protein